MNREEAILRLRVQREQAAEVLEKFQKGIYGHGGKVGVAIDTAIAALRGPQPDPITGLVPCGCGGKARLWPSDPTQFTHVITDYEAGCTECAMTTGWVRGKQENAMKVWNTAMGYTAPPRPGAIGPDAGEMAPNGDEGAEL